MLKIYSYSFAPRVRRLLLLGLVLSLSVAMLAAAAHADVVTAGPASVGTTGSDNPSNTIAVANGGSANGGIVALSSTGCATAPQNATFAIAVTTGGNCSYPGAMGTFGVNAFGRAESSHLAISGTGPAYSSGYAAVGGSYAGPAAYTPWVAVSPNGDAWGRFLAFSLNGNATASGYELAPGLSPGIAISGTRCAQAPQNGGVALAATTGAGSCSYPGAMGAIGVNGTGRSESDLVAISAFGPAYASGYAAVGGSYAGPAAFTPMASVSHSGDAWGRTLAFSGLGSATAQDTNSAAISGAGNATGGSLALSGNRTASSSGIALSGLGSAEGGLVAVSGGNATGGMAAISQGGDANGGIIGISASGSASGSTASLSGNDNSGRVGTTSFSLTPEATLYDTSGDSDYNYTFPGDFDDEPSDDEGMVSVAYQSGLPFSSSSGAGSVSVAESDPIRVAPGTPGIGGDCGSKITVKKNRYHSAAITRTGAGTDSNGHQYISYHLHFQSKFRDNTYSSRMKPYYTNHHTGRVTTEPWQEKHPWYFHVTRRVLPGGIVGFDAYALFYPPIPSAQYPGRYVYGTKVSEFWCIAR